MKKNLILPTMVLVGVVSVLMSGCNKASTSQPDITNKAAFGSLGAPMPQAAKDYMAKHNAGGQPAGAAKQ